MITRRRAQLRDQVGELALTARGPQCCPMDLRRRVIVVDLGPEWRSHSQRPGDQPAAEASQVRQRRAHQLVQPLVTDLLGSLEDDQRDGVRRSRRLLDEKPHRIRRRRPDSRQSSVPHRDQIFRIGDDTAQNSRARNTADRSTLLWSGLEGTHWDCGRFAVTGKSSRRSAHAPGRPRARRSRRCLIPRLHRRDRPPVPVDPATGAAAGHFPACRSR